MTTTDVRLFTIWVTAYYPNVEHAVTDEEMAARNAENRGEFRALCGAVFLPAPSTRPPGGRCPTCVRFDQVRATLPELASRLDGSHTQRARHGRQGWWGRLLACGRGR
jgi:hypothetical protein